MASNVSFSNVQKQSETSKSKRKSLARNDDPNRVKRPVPASWMFREEHRQKIIDEHFNGEKVNSCLVSRKAKELWHNLSQEVKEPYETRREKMWQAYKKANPSKPKKNNKITQKVPLVPIWTTKEILNGRKIKELSPSEKKTYEMVKKQNQRYKKNMEKYQQQLEKDSAIRDQFSSNSSVKSLTNERLGCVPSETDDETDDEIEVEYWNHKGRKFFLDPQSDIVYDLTTQEEVGKRKRRSVNGIEYFVLETL